jgi:hypothetical protein
MRSPSPTGTVVQLVSMWRRSVHCTLGTVDAMVVAAHVQVQQVVPNRWLAHCTQHTVFVSLTQKFPTN